MQKHDEDHEDAIEKRVLNRQKKTGVQEQGQW